MPLKQQYVSVLAVLVVVATTGALWNIDAYRSGLEQSATSVEPGVSGGLTGPARVSSLADTTTPSGVNATVTEARAVPASGTPEPARSTAASATSTLEPVAKDAEPATPLTTPPRTGTSPSATPTPRPDFDGDGIPDAVDRCPTRAETRNGFRDGDGCPDVVATSGAS